MRSASDSRTRFGAFLSAGRSSIYAALGSLMDAGLIEKMAGRSTTVRGAARRRGPPTGRPPEARAHTGDGWPSASAPIRSVSRCSDG